MYACIVANSHLDKLQQLLAYQTVLVREARRYGGNGWQAYDTMFRQQVANDPAADWSKLNSSLYSVTFLAYQNGSGKTCLHCLETDHSGSDCALASTKGHRMARPPINDDIRNTRAKLDRGECSTRICYSWNDGRCAVPRGVARIFLGGFLAVARGARAKNLKTTPTFRPCRLINDRHFQQNFARFSIFWQRKAQKEEI